MNNQEEAKKFFLDGINSYSEKNYEKAIIEFEKSLSLAPNRPSILLNLSKSYFQIKNYREAKKNLQILLSLNNCEQEKKDALKTILEIHTKENNIDEIIYNNKKINISNIENKVQFLKYKLFYPSLFSSEEQINNARKNIESNIDELIHSKDCPKLDLENEMIDPINFWLSYDGKDNLGIYKKLIKLYSKIYQIEDEEELKFEKNSDKIKIGFISEFFTDHTIIKWFKGIIYKLDKNKFEVSVFHSDKTLPGIKFEEIKRNEFLYGYENIFLPKNFHEKKKLIQDKKLDVLFYTDIHMSSNLYFLTLFKLARYQMTTWGHPETTGNKKIDFYLSSKLVETEGYQEKYSEKVILSDLLPLYIYKPEIKSKLDKDHLSKKNIYSCPQAIFKMHPSFDKAIKKILNKDRKAEMFFLKDKNKILYKQFYKRLKNTLGNEIDRVKFLDPISVEGFINHCGQASVLLNPFIFGSGNSFMESMYYGTPTVSMHTDYMKSRIVTGTYKQMEILDAPVFSDIDDYVEKSIEISNKGDSDLKKYYADQANKYIFDNDNFIKEFEEIITSNIN